MSGPAVIAVKVIGTMYAAKTAMERVKEGNIMKAALGAFGAYMGMSNIAAAGTENLATGGSENLLGEAAKDVSLAVESPAPPVLAPELGSASEAVLNPPAEIVPDDLWGDTSKALDIGYAPASDSIAESILDTPTLYSTNSPAPDAGGGIMDWIEEHPTAAVLGMQGLGATLTGHEANKLKREELGLVKKNYQNKNSVPTTRLSYGVR